MKRFWTSAAAFAAGGGWGVALDGRPVKTPARADLTVPTEALANAIADEWSAAPDTVDPRAMPLTGLANAAIDRIVPDRAAFAAGLARYGEGDLTCYRAGHPQALCERQRESWDALLGWARRRYDIDFETTEGISHVAQPPATVERLAHEVGVLDAFRLAGLAPMVTVSGSLLAGLAVLDGAVSADAAWRAVTVDDRWQAEQWGADAEAEAALANREADFRAGARFLELLDA